MDEDVVDNNSRNRTFGTGAGQQQQLHLVPRIDNIMFQAEIPRIYEPEQKKAERVSKLDTTDSNIYGMKYLFERGLNTNCRTTYSTIFESDDYYLALLRKYHFNENDLNFFMTSILSFGKDRVHVKRIKTSIEKLPKTSMLDAKLEQLISVPTIMHGHFTSSDLAFSRDYWHSVEHIELGKSDGVDTVESLMNEKDKEGTDARRLKSDKQESKKKWVSILKSANSILSNCQASSVLQRPHFTEIQDMLTNIIKNCLPCPSDIVLGDIYDSVQTVLGDLILRYMDTREWISEVYDAVFAIGNSVNSCDISDLRKLLTESANLSFSNTCEETQIKRMLQNYDKWENDMSKFLDVYSSYSLSYNSNEFTGHKIAYAELEALIERCQDIPNAWRSQSKNMSILQDISDKISDLMLKIEELINQALVCSGLGDKKSRIKKISLKLLLDINDEISHLPIQLPDIDKFNNLVKCCMSWKNDVTVSCDMDKTGKSLSLKKIDSLINDGESLPVDMSEDLDILKEKRNQGKLWLEKLKKSLLKSKNRATRKSGGGVIDTAEKVDLTDMKKLVEEGEALYDDSRNKELNNALNVVDTAEEWITRVKEMLSDGEMLDIESLKELLEETEDMPVMMQEAQLLKTHIEALEWAEKVRPYLGAVDVKLSVLQKYGREINSIRASSVQCNSGFDVLQTSLPEEMALDKILLAAEGWLAKVKRVFQGTVVRNGVTLSHLVELCQEATELKLDLGNDNKKITQIVTEVNEWIAGSALVLRDLGINIESSYLTQSELNTENTSQVTNNTTVNYEDLHRVHELAKGFTIDFPELRELRLRYSEVHEWLDRVKNIVPKRIKRGGKANRITVSELEDLLDEGRKLRVDFYKENNKVLEAIAEAKELEAHMQSAMLTIGETCGQAHEKYLAFVHTIEATNFPFIVSASAHLQENPLIESLISGDGGLVNKELFLSIPSKENDNISNDFVENKLWADVEGGILKSLRELQAQWEENGVVTESVRLLEICLGIIMWADAVRKVITSVNWGDIKRSHIKSLFTDFSKISKLYGSNSQYDAHYASTILDNLNITYDPSSFALLVAEYNEDNNTTHNNTNNNPDEIVNGANAEHELGTNVMASSGDMSIDEERKGRRKSIPHSKVRQNEFTKVDDSVHKKQKKNRDSSPLRMVNTVAVQNMDDSPTVGVTGSKKRSRNGNEINPKLSKNDTLVKEDEVESFLNGNCDGITLPISFQCFSDFWFRWLTLFQRRLYEYDIWQYVADCILNSRPFLAKQVHAPSRRVLKNKEQTPSTWENISLKASQEDIISNLLLWSSSRGLVSSLVRTIENRCKGTIEWTQQADEIIAGNRKVNLESLIAFIKDGEKMLLFSRGQLNILKDTQKRAKSWIAKFEKVDISSVPADTLKKFVDEAAEIPVDLSVYTDPIKQGTEVYCLCRQVYHGLMIGCDVCDDWCHSACLGYTKLHAERNDRFVCLRCLLRTSFVGACQSIASTVNVWVFSSENALRCAELRKQKLSRKISKEERELQKINHQLSVLRQGSQCVTKAAEATIPSATQSSSLTQLANPEVMMQTVTDSSEITSSVITGNNTETAESIRPRNETDPYYLSIIKAESSLELDLSNSQERLRKMRIEEQEVIKVFSLTTEGIGAVIAWMQSIQRMLWPVSAEDVESGRPTGISGGDLPVGVLAAVTESKKYYIDEVEDVLIVVEYFKWMSWCYHCLDLIRGPPTLRELTQLCNMAKGLRFADEKIVKAIQAILTRATNWRVKVRKFMVGSKSLDANKAHGLLLEGNSIPFTSPLKDILTYALKEYTANAPVESSGEKSETLGSGRKAAVKSYENIKYVTIPPIPEDCDNDYGGYKFMYPIPSAHLASSPSNLWPPKLSIAPLSPSPANIQRLSGFAATLAPNAYKVSNVTKKNDDDMHAKRNHEESLEGDIHTEPNKLMKIENKNHFVQHEVDVLPKSNNVENGATDRS